MQDEWMAPSEALVQARPEPLREQRALPAVQVRFGYRIGGMRLLVGIGVLSEFLTAPSIYPIPNAPAALRGYINRQGALVPVWDLRLILGAGEGPDASDDSAETPTRGSNHRNSVLVMGRQDHGVGLLMNELPRSLKRTEYVARLPRLPDAFNGYVNGALLADGALWCEFDHEGFFRAQAKCAAA